MTATKPIPVSESDPVSPQPTTISRIIGAWPFWIMVVAFAEVAEVIVLVFT